MVSEIKKHGSKFKVKSNTNIQDMVPNKSQTNKCARYGDPTMKNKSNVQDMPPNKSNTKMVQDIAPTKVKQTKTKFRI